MMICGMTVKRECAYSKICGMADCYVADDSECADLIVEIAGRLEGLDAIEEELLREEREAIQKECDE